MRITHLHFFRWDRPNFLLKIDLMPFGASQFPGPDEKLRRKLKSDLR
jgi:hypothetical protein